MRTLYANYVFAILVLFFFKIVLIDQVRAGLRSQHGKPAVVENGRAIASSSETSARLAPIR